jgi:hypothetical protein
MTHEFQLQPPLLGAVDEAYTLHRVHADDKDTEVRQRSGDRGITPALTAGQVTCNFELGCGLVDNTPGAARPQARFGALEDGST